MEIINSTTEGFKHARVDKKPTVTFGDKRFHIAASAVLEFDIKAGMYIHFVVDVDRVYFFANGDKSGMKIFGKSDSVGLHGYVSTRRRLLEKKMPGVSFYKSYPVRLLPTKFNGHNLIEILIHKKP